ncbi:hypothetical protein ACS0TY_014134 [Phlomoides rotata]
MVFFKNSTTSSGTHYLVILDDEHQPLDKGTWLDVDTPLISKYVELVPEATNNYHWDEWTQEITLDKTSKAWVLKAVNHSKRMLMVEEPLPTLGRCIVMRKAKWVPIEPELRDIIKDLCIPQSCKFCSGVYGGKVSIMAIVVDFDKSFTS